jgi:hypothetical protein
MECLECPWSCIHLKHADRDWYEYICRIYIDTAQYKAENYSIVNLRDTSYFDAHHNGILWHIGCYCIYHGTPEDWLCFYGYTRVTRPNLSNIQLIQNADDYQKYWDWTLDANLAYIQQILNGIRGRVKVNGRGVRAKVFILNHDENIDGVDYHSYIFSDSTGNGCYARPIDSGTYTVNYKVINGLGDTTHDSTITGVFVENGKPTHKDVFFYSTHIKTYSNSINQADVKIKSIVKGFILMCYNLNGDLKTDIYDIKGTLVKSLASKSNSIKWNGLNNNSGRVGAGYYLLKITAKDKIFTMPFILVD